jgi:adenylate kinase family enzyme
MAVKLFILGLPGSGKSTVSRHITAYVRHKGWEILHLSDHFILKEMFLADSNQKRFKPADHGGFDVLDVIVRDIALQKLEQEVNTRLLSVKQEEIVLIEFARNDYHRAFQQFSNTFLQDAYFLYLDVETDICQRRINERIVNPNSEDDFYVSEYIFTTYYNENNGRSIPQILARDFGMDQLRVKVIDNNGSLLASNDWINHFVDTICGLEILRDA